MVPELTTDSRSSRSIPPIESDVKIITRTHTRRIEDELLPEWNSQNADKVVT
jgi:hypothetical protein